MTLVPHNLKSMFVRPALLAYGEGETEQAFANFLKDLYGRNSRSIQVLCGHGGGFDHTLNKALIAMEGRNSGLLLFDRPKKMTDDLNKLQQKANKIGLELLESNPCIETFFLEILEVQHKPAQCKKIFDNLIGKKSKRDPQTYKSLFKRAILEKKRKTLVNLDRIISMIITSSKPI